MKQYLNLADSILNNGHARTERTGTGVLSVFGPQLMFDLRDGFPALTTKKVFIKGALVELLWMISGESNAQFMLENDVHIWDEWLSEDNELGPVYGVQWRKWMAYHLTNVEDGLDVEVTMIDQLQTMIDTIRNNPHDRRMIVNAWNVADLQDMALPPCPTLYQVYVEDEWLDLKLYQRSADVFLGLPFDMIVYSTLLHMIAHITGKKPRRLIMSLGDTHVYTNHLNQIVEQISRDPYELPTINVNVRNREINEIDDFELEDIEIIGYKHHPKLKGVVSK